MPEPKAEVSSRPYDHNPRVVALYFCFTSRETTALIIALENEDHIVNHLLAAGVPMQVGPPSGELCRAGEGEFAFLEVRRLGATTENQVALD